MLLLVSVFSIALNAQFIYKTQLMCIFKFWYDAQYSDHRTVRLKIIANYFVFLKRVLGVEALFVEWTVRAHLRKSMKRRPRSLRIQDRVGGIGI